MKKTFFVILWLTVTASFAGKAEKIQAIKETERKELQNALDKSRDSLQELVTKQYAFEQQAVEMKEANKDEFDKLHEQQDRMETELARIKEEKLNREQSLADEIKNLEAKKEEWTYLQNQIKDIFQKDADGLLEAFPLDKELRRAELEKIRASLSERHSPTAAFGAFVNYRLAWLALGDSISLAKAVVLPEDGSPKQLTISRFGNVFGYGIDPAAGTCYYLRQTGRLGSDRFSVEKIAAPQLATKLTEQFPKWLSTGRITGDVLMEVMQNDQARMLIAGKRQSTGLALYESFAKGGWVMIPMLMLPFWVLYLMVVKIAQYAGRGSLLKKQYVTAMKFLEKKEFNSALAWAKTCKRGVMARIVAASLERQSQGRQTGERAAYEILTLETPPLRRHLNTLAVIAGAAPLLGLLGTISGMITLFAAVTHFGTGDPKFLAGGISEALITAKTGLAIAIPVLFIHDLLRAAKDRLMADLENDTIAVLNAVYPEE
ncbi:MAG TPA: MotA/TolQ/ExbB proton channel family protein [Chitinivibrionales bacterium]|nr:MotA/TolQ/ExbB proton channel family protein [Chitinivibrionales bacterium]